MAKVVKLQPGVTDTPPTVGRPVFILRDLRGTSSSILETAAAELERDPPANSWLGMLEPLAANSYQQQVVEIEQGLVAAQAKQVTVVAWGAAAVVAQALACTDSKLVRNLVLVAPEFGNVTGASSRVVQWIEEHLPLGLPLRIGAQDIDSRATLQRVRCPTIVVVPQQAPGNSQIFLNRVSTAWRLDATGDAQSLAKIVREAIQKVQEIPAKAPQKAR